MNRIIEAFRIRVVLPALLCALAAGAGAQTLPGVSFPAPEPRAAEEQPQEGFAVSAALEPESQARGGAVLAGATFVCPEGWLIYADSIGLELFAPDGDLPLEVGRFVLPGPKVKQDEWLGEEVRYLDGTFTASLVLQVAGDAPAGRHALGLRVTYQGCSTTLCFQPVTLEREVTLTVLEAGSAPVAVRLPEPEPGGPTGGKPWWLLILLAYVGGIAMLGANPCVWPMIPITLSVIGAASTERRLSAVTRSLAYVLGIALIYAVLGAVAASMGRTFGTLLQHPAVYVGLAVLMAALAAAMFDLYSIQFGASWSARMQARLLGKYGIFGVFLLGLLSGIALTPCVTPVVSSVLVGLLQTGDAAFGFAAMFALALGMGTPLAVVGTFGGLAKSLPKGGRWQVVIKRAFGLALVGAALYYVERSNLLPQTWFWMFTGGVLLVASVFAGAFDAVPQEADRWLRVRKAVGLLLLAGAVAAFIQPLLSGLPEGEAGGGGRIEWAEPLDQALATAKAEGKPMMIYFRQDFCPVCEELKGTTFRDPGVAEESERFVCVRVDGTRWPPATQRLMREQYGVYGFPTIALVDSEGKVARDRRLEGYVSPGRLLGAMRAVR